MLALQRRTFFDHLLWSILQSPLHILKITIFSLYCVFWTPNWWFAGCSFFDHLPYIVTGFLTFWFLGLESYLLKVTASLEWGACRHGLCDLLGNVANGVQGWCNHVVQPDLSFFNTSGHWNCVCESCKDYPIFSLSVWNCIDLILEVCKHVVVHLAFGFELLQ